METPVIPGFLHKLPEFCVVLIIIVLYIPLLFLMFGGIQSHGTYIFPLFLFLSLRHKSKLDSV